MEVHHHPHVEKKSFKEYLLEGLMIFVAVMMGFIAENIRESIIEHETEKRNMELIVENLKEDTTQLSYNIRSNNKTLIIIDSFLLLRDKSLKDSNTVKSFYSYFLRSLFSYPFTSNNSAFEMMKNSGSIRFVKKKQVLDSLYKYDYLRKVIVGNEAGYDIYKNKALEESGNFLLYDNNHASIINIDQKADAINRFYQYYYVVVETLRIVVVPQLKKELEIGKRLIKLLEEEYHLEDKK